MTGLAPLYNPSVQSKPIWLAVVIPGTLTKLFGASGILAANI
jgi:hypothetical protein